MKCPRAMTAVLACVSLACCAVPKVIMFDSPFPPKPADAKIQIFSAAMPDRPFIEIAEISCSASSDKYNMKHILIKARQIGADALILKGNTGSSAVAFPVGKVAVAGSSGYGLRFTAIRWKD